MAGLCFVTQPHLVATWSTIFFTESVNTYFHAKDLKELSDNLNQMLSSYIPKNLSGQSTNSIAPL